MGTATSYYKHYYSPWYRAFMRDNNENENQPKDYKNITPIRVLSLDCIFLITTSEELTPFTSEELDVKWDRKLGYTELPDYTANWCRQASRLKDDGGSSDWDLIKLLMTFQEAAVEKKYELSLAFYRCLYESLCTSLPTLNLPINEDTLVHRHLHALLSWVFCQDKVFQHKWSNAILSLFKEIRTGSLKPVFTAFFYENRKQFDIFVVEVKKPGVSEGYDLIKLGYMMRKMLVVLIKEKVKAPMVVGMIVNGYQCTTYRMHIVSAHVFKFIEMRKFNLPSQDNEITNIDLIVESLYQIKILSFAVNKRIKKHFEDQKKKSGAVDIVPLEFIPPSRTPMISVSQAIEPSTSTSAAVVAAEAYSDAATSSVTTTVTEASAKAEPSLSIVANAATGSSLSTTARARTASTSPSKSSAASAKKVNPRVQRVAKKKKRGA